jgi:hypothetical protein
MAASLKLRTLRIHAKRINCHKFLQDGGDRAMPQDPDLIAPGSGAKLVVMPQSAASRNVLESALTRDAGIEMPIICGAMYPCSNPERVAAVSQAGGIGSVQRSSMTYVHSHRFRAGLRPIRCMTRKPIGMNALIERSSRRYHATMERWIDIALEEGVRFFVTSLGKPGWVAQRVHAAGGVVYHDVTERKWALKGLEGNVDGFICVNNRAGGHAGKKDVITLFRELADLGKPLVCAGGVAAASDFVEALSTGYAGVQMGTRFIATPECHEGRANCALDVAGFKHQTPDAHSLCITLTLAVETGVAGRKWHKGLLAGGEECCPHQSDRTGRHHHPSLCRDGATQIDPGVTDV